MPSYFSKPVIISSFIIFLAIVLTIKLNPTSVLGSHTNLSPAVILSQVNLARTKAGLNPLKVNLSLESAASSKAADMVSRAYFAHQYPGQDPWEFLNNSGYRYLHAGENLAQDFNDTESLISAWLESPGHRQIMLNPVYSESGVGIASKPNGKGIVIVQYFATPGNQFTSPLSLSQSEIVHPTITANYLLIILCVSLVLVGLVLAIKHHRGPATLSPKLWRLTA